MYSGPLYNGLCGRGGKKEKPLEGFLCSSSHHNVLKMIHNSGACIRNQIDNDESVPRFVLLFIFHILE